MLPPARLPCCPCCPCCAGAVCGQEGPRPVHQLALLRPHRRLRPQAAAAAQGGWVGGWVPPLPRVRQGAGTIGLQLLPYAALPPLPCFSSSLLHCTCLAAQLHQLPQALAGHAKRYRQAGSGVLSTRAAAAASRPARAARPARRSSPPTPKSSRWTRCWRGWRRAACAASPLPWLFLWPFFLHFLTAFLLLSSPVE